jgi:hypothetical protein
VSGPGGAWPALVFAIVVCALTAPGNPTTIEQKKNAKILTHPQHATGAALRKSLSNLIILVEHRLN